MPEEHHKRTILQRLLTLLYIIHHLILRATKFLQEQLSKEHAATLYVLYTITIAILLWKTIFLLSN